MRILSDNSVAVRRWSLILTAIMMILSIVAFCHNPSDALSSNTASDIFNIPFGDALFGLIVGVSFFTLTLFFRKRGKGDDWQEKLMQIAFLLADVSALTLFTLVVIKSTLFFGSSFASSFLIGSVLMMKILLE